MLTAVRGILSFVPRATSAHNSRDFETELRELQAHLLAMGARCERVVGLALGAQIDRDELEIHALILRILALRQPVADDLRFLATALRLIADIETLSSMRHDSIGRGCK